MLFELKPPPVKLCCAEVLELVLASYRGQVIQTVGSSGICRHLAATHVHREETCIWQLAHARV